MGRTITSDESIQNTVKLVTQLPDCLIGLAIGQNTPVKDFLCHLASTPIKALEEEKAVNTKQTNVKRNVKTKSATVVDDIDETLLEHHAKQVIRMLPGGISIIGIFTVYSGDSLPSNTLSKLKQILIGIFKMLNKQPCSSPTIDVPEKYILHINPSSQKIVAKVIDLSNIQNAAKPAEFHIQKGGLKWHSLDCRLALDLSINIGSENSKLPLLKQINNSIIPFCKVVESAIVLIDDRLLKGDDPLDPIKEPKRGKHKEKNAANLNHDVELFMELFSQNKKDEKILNNCAAKMHIKGALKSRAYVHAKAVAEEAVQAVKQDIIRSLIARLEIHCEDLLLIDEEQHDPFVIHEPPRRVFALLPGSKITVSDYLFSGENAKDSLEAYSELLTLTLTEDEIEFDCEKIAESSDLAPCPSETGKSVATSFDMINVSSCSRSGNILVAGLSIAILALATSIAHIFLSRE